MPRHYPNQKGTCRHCGWEMGIPHVSRHEAAHVRFWSLVDKSGECWLWRGTVSAYGYAVFGSHRKGTRDPYAHRQSYIWSKGPIPVGFEVDHLCRTKLCVRPDHLEAVTKAENIRRQNRLSSGTHHRALTHCPQGHPYSGRNLYVTRDGWRQCRTCSVARTRRWRAEQKGAAA